MAPNGWLDSSGAPLLFCNDAPHLPSRCGYCDARKAIRQSGRSSAAHSDDLGPAPATLLAGDGLRVAEYLIENRVCHCPEAVAGLSSFGIPLRRSAARIALSLIGRVSISVHSALRSSPGRTNTSSRNADGTAQVEAPKKRSPCLGSPRRCAEAHRLSSAPSPPHDARSSPERAHRARLSSDRPWIYRASQGILGHKKAANH